MNGCGEAKRFSTDKYLAYCANRKLVPLIPKAQFLILLDAACFARRCTATKMDGSPFCEDHTCRERGCLTATSAQPYCVDRKPLNAVFPSVQHRSDLLVDRCNEPSCQNSRARTSNPDSEGEFCPLRKRPPIQH